MRVFAPREQINLSAQEIILQESETAHLRARRAKTGDIITVSTREGHSYAAKIRQFDKHSAHLVIVNAYPEPFGTEPRIKVTLFQALPKYGKFEMVVQKCVELGVFDIYPVITEFTQYPQRTFKTARFTAVSKAAAEQAGREVIPRVHEPISLQAAIELVKQSGYDIILAAWENEARRRIRDCLSGKDTSAAIQKAAIFIGPEGGFSPREAKIFKENSIKTVSLGKRILRAETAGFTALTIFFNETGEF